MEPHPKEQDKHWYAMRDLKRSNALLPAYKQLKEAGIELFTPMITTIFHRNGRRIRKEVPVMRDLLFVYESRQNLDPIVARTPTLQYRFKRGGKQGEPIVIAKEEMERFIRAVQSTENPKFYSAEEISPLMCGRMIRMVGGVLNGYEGRLQTVRGSKRKRIVISLSTLMAVSVCIENEYIELL